METGKYILYQGALKKQRSILTQISIINKFYLIYFDILGQFLYSLRNLSQVYNIAYSSYYVGVAEDFLGDLAYNIYVNFA